MAISSRYISELNDKYKLKTNFLRYQQIISAIPVCIRNEASQSLFTRRLSEQDDNLFQLSKGKVLVVPKMRCKVYYQLFLEKKDK